MPNSPQLRNLLELVPHYIVMVLLVVLAFNVVWSIVGVPNLLVTLVVILCIVVLYQLLVSRVGFVPTPSRWERWE
jgi:hypothetical protein